MNVLLDTRVLVWWLRNSARLGKHAKALIRDNATSVWVSSATIWEISIKAALDRLELDEEFEQRLPAELERSGFRLLAVKFDHAFGVRRLPLHHRDPFDRMLIAQAQWEGLTLVTADPNIMAYDVRTVDASA